MLKALGAGILNILYPASCRVCGGPAGEGGFFCAPCAGEIKRIAGPFCSVCGRPFPGGAGGVHPCRDCMKKMPPFDMARAPAVYGGTVKEAIHIFKYGRVRAMRAYLGGLAAEGAREWFAGAGVASAVPLHPRRFRERGFNQSLFLAEAAAGALGIPLSMDGLARTRHTRPQVDLGPEEREKNVRGAFSVVRPDDFKGRAVLLVDDVYTTGATVRECARALRKAGAEKVFVLTAARVE